MGLYGHEAEVLGVRPYFIVMECFMQLHEHCSVMFEYYLQSTNATPP